MTISTHNWTFNYANSAAAIADGYRIYDPSTLLAWDSSSAGLSAGSGASHRAGVLTSSADSSGWAAIFQFVATLTEVVGFEFRFLVTFNDTASGEVVFFNRHVNGLWFSVANSLNSTAEILNAVFNVGLSRGELMAARNFPPPGVGTTLAVLVGLRRNSGSGDGRVDNLAAQHGTELVEFPNEGTAVDALPFAPEYPLELTPEVYDAAHEFEMGYTQMVELATRLRRRGQMQFVLSPDDAATMKAFIDSHLDTPFSWQPIGDASGSWWFFTQPASVQFVTTGARRISTGVEELI